MPRSRILDLSKADLASPTQPKHLYYISHRICYKIATNMLAHIAVFRKAPCLRHIVFDKHQEPPFYELEHYEGDCVYMDRVQDFCACAGTTDLRWLLPAIVSSESAAVLLRLPLPMDPGRIADDIQHLPRLYNLTRILLDGAKPNGTGADGQWYIKFLGPLRTPQTNRTHSGIACFIGCFPLWLHTLQLALDDYRPTTCFTLQFSKMTICTSDLVLFSR